MNYNPLPGPTTLHARAPCVSAKDSAQMAQSSSASVGSLIDFKAEMGKGGMRSEEHHRAKIRDHYKDAKLTALKNYFKQAKQASSSLGLRS